MSKPSITVKVHLKGNRLNEAIDNNLNISNIEKMIEDDNTDGSQIFPAYEWEKRLIYDYTDDSRLRLQYRYYMAMKIVTGMLKGEIEVCGQYVSKKPKTEKTKKSSKLSKDVIQTRRNMIKADYTSLAR